MKFLHEVIEIEHTKSYSLVDSGVRDRKTCVTQKKRDRRKFQKRNNN